MQAKFALTILVAAAAALGGCGDDGTNNGTDNNSTTVSTDPTPVWRLGATDVTPQVDGSAIALDGDTITLSDSEPAGWTVTFTSDGDLEPFTTYVSDSDTGRVEGEISGPGGTCEVTMEGGILASLQTTELSPIPTGSGTVSGECFGAPMPGVSLNVVFGDATAIGAD